MLDTTPRVDEQGDLEQRYSLTHVKHGATRSTAQCARKHLRARSTLALQQKRVALLVGWTSGVFLSLSFLRACLPAYPSMAQTPQPASTSISSQGGLSLVILGRGVDFAYLFFLFIDCATDLVCMLVGFS